MTASRPDDLDRLLGETAAQFELGAWEWEIATHAFRATAGVAGLLRSAGDTRPLTLDSLREALLEPGRTAFEAALARARSHGNSWDFAARLRHVDGTERFVQLRGAPVGRDGQCTHLRGAVQVLPAASSSVESRDSERTQRDLQRRLELAAAAAGVGFFEIPQGPGENTWSPRLREIYGIGPDEPVPDRATWRHRFLHPEDADFQQQRVTESFTTGFYECEHRIVRADGAERWVSSQAVLSEGRRWFGITVDITARKLAEQRMHDALDRFELAAAGSGVGVWQRHLDRDSARWSNEMFRLYGLPVSGQAPHWEELLAAVHPGDRASFESQWQRLVLSTEFIDSEFRVRHADGSTHWLLERGRVEPASGRRRARVVGVAVDITQRKHAEQQARDSARWLEIASHAMRLGLWRRDLRTGTLHWNEELRHMFGLRADEPTPDVDGALAYVLSEDRPKVLKSREWPRDGQSIVEVEYRIRRKDGEIRTLLSRGAIERDSEGEPRVAYSAIIDVTEQRQAARALDEAQQRLRLAAEAGRFASWERNLETNEGRWDPILFDFYGLPRGEAAPPLETVLTLIHPQDHARCMEAWTRVRDDPGVTEWEARILRPDGRIVHLVSRAYAERRADGMPWRVVGASLDVTESRQAAQALEQTLERLHAATETGGVGVWERDLATDAAYWDPVMYSLYGLTPRAKGPTRAEAEAFVHPDDRATVDAAWQRIKQIQHAVEFEYRVPRADGSVAYLNSRGRCIRDAAGRPLRVVGATIDVSASRSVQQQLREMDEFVKLASGVTGIGFFRQGLDNLTSFTDAQMKRVFGFDPAGPEPTREEFEARVVPEDRPIMRSARERGRSSRQPLEVEYRIRRPDGDVRHVLTRRALVSDEAGRPSHVVGTAIDVTDRHLGERERERLARRIDVATSELQLGLWEWDPHAHASIWNDQMYALFGRTRADFANLVWLDVVHPEDRDFARAELADVVVAGRSFDIEFRVVWPDGQVRWLAARGRAQRDAAGRTSHVYGVNWDITERRSAELEREALAKRMQIAADAAHIGLWEHDVDGGEGRWNAANFTLWGVPRAARPPALAEIATRVHPEDRPLFLTQFRAAAAGHEPDDLEYRVQHGDGSTVVLRTRVRRVGALHRHRVVGVNIDVTQQRLAEQAVIAKEAAERANEAKTEFLSRMSHELRTPLNAILGFAQLLELNPAEPLSTQQRGNVEHIQKAGWHLVALIDEVLDLARIESGRMALSIERVALQGVIEESLALIHGDAAARGLHLEQHTLPDAPTHVAADRVRLKQVLANLLSNAVKYNRDNGLVAIEVAASHDGGARLTVRDTGRGMTAEQLARVFEPFNRLGLEHSGIAGTGIGLSISRKLVLQMKGAVEVTSEQGIGTRFVVTLPAAPVPEEARSVAIPVGSRRRDDVVGIVLYVEDNESNVRLVEQLLALRPGVKLVVASEAAGARVLAAVTQPDLVLIDMRLPDATGIEVLRDVRRQSYTAALPCIAVSANALPEEIAVARAAGFDDYLTKPLGAEQFLATIDAALVRHRGIDARTQA